MQTREMAPTSKIKQRRRKVKIELHSHKFSYMCRPAQLAELSRSKFDPELFSHSAYDKFFVTFATKVSYLTFCNEM